MRYSYIFASVRFSVFHMSWSVQTLLEPFMIFMQKSKTACCISFLFKVKPDILHRHWPSQFCGRKNTVVELIFFYRACWWVKLSLYSLNNSETKLLKDIEKVLEFISSTLFFSKKECTLDISNFNRTNLQFSRLFLKISALFYSYFWIRLRLWTHIFDNSTNPCIKPLLFCFYWW